MFLHTVRTLKAFLEWGEHAGIGNEELIFIFIGFGTRGRADGGASKFRASEESSHKK